MRVAIIGTGTVGAGLAKGFERSGHEVVLGSRDPGSKRDLPARVVSSRDAAAEGEIVVNALPGHVALAAFRDEIGEAATADKPLMDVANALTDTMDLVYADSLGQRLQQALPLARVVKTLSTVNAPLMTASDRLAGRTAVFLSGDDKAAKAVVSELLSDLGWSPDSQVDLGGIETAQAVEHYLLLSIAYSRSIGGSSAYNLEMVGKATQ